jgi:hypothetical protein
MSKRRALPIVLMVLTAPPVVVTTLIASTKHEGGITPAFACSGYIMLPAVPYRYAESPRVPSNTRVLLYDSPSVLTQTPKETDDIAFVETQGQRPGAIEGKALPFERREVAPGLFEVTPNAPLRPGQSYALVWRESTLNPIQAAFTATADRDEEPPRIGRVGPAELPPLQARTSCDTAAQKLTVPFAYEDASDIVVGVWDGATSGGRPLGWSRVWQNRVTIDLPEGKVPTEVTFVAFDTAGHRSLPCSLAIGEVPAAKGIRMGCGKSSVPAASKMQKNCSS